MNSLESALPVLRGRRLVYVATPYTNYRGGHDLAARNAATACAALMRAGIVAFSPIAHSHHVGVAGGLDLVDPDMWRRQDAAHIEAADAATVVTMQGWRTSRGVTGEIAAFVYAGKPLVFIDPADVGITDDPKSPRLIGLMGFGGAGKTTIANILRERHGFAGPHIKTPLANMLRSLLRDFGHDAVTIERYIDGDLKREVVPEIGKSPTELQQTLGFEWGRDKVRPEIWLDWWLMQADAILAGGGAVVQESVRTAGEAAAIRDRGGILVEVRRPGYTGSNDHSSEAIVATPDGVIDNDGSLDELASKVEALLAG